MKKFQDIFVPIELATLANEKDFNYPCIGVHIFDEEKQVYEKVVLSVVISGLNLITKEALIALNSPHIVAPIYHDLLDWFEEVHEIFIVVNYNSTHKMWHYTVSGPDDYSRMYHPNFKSKYEAYSKGLIEAFKLI